MAREPVLAIVLAAGSGKRLGAPKAALDLLGRTALERCVEALRAGGAGTVRAVLAAGDEAGLAAAGRAGAMPVFNREPERGQTSSLKAGLRAGPAPASPWLLHTVDHPLLQADDVAALLAACVGPAAIAVPVVGGRRGHPVAFCPRVVPELVALGDDEPVHGVVRRDPSRVACVERANPWLAADLDTPEDLAAVLAELRRREARAAP